MLNYFLSDFTTNITYMLQNSRVFTIGIILLGIGLIRSVYNKSRYKEVDDGMGYMAIANFFILGSFIPFFNFVIKLDFF